MNRYLLQLRKILWLIVAGLLVLWLLTVSAVGRIPNVYAQDKISDQVAVTVLPHAVAAVMSGSGLIRKRLSAGERVVSTEAKGFVAFVQTSNRLLGFTGQLQRWREKRLDVTENVETFHITPRLVVVKTDRHLFGFGGLQGLWHMVDIGIQEEVRQIVAGDNVAVVVTNKKVLGFSAFTGGFFAEDLSNDEIVQELRINDNIAILEMPSRQLIFRSQLAVWAEVR